MNFLGIGTLELVVILVVALVVLGPAGTVNLGKGVGRVVGELRRAVSALPSLADDEGGGWGSEETGKEARPTTRKTRPEDPR